MKTIKYQVNRFALNLMWHMSRIEEMLADQAGNYDLAYTLLLRRWDIQRQIFILDLNNGVRP
jgi:hypothetical protein